MQAGSMSAENSTFHANFVRGADNGSLDPAFAGPVGDSQGGALALHGASVSSPAIARLSYCTVSQNIAEPGYFEDFMNGGRGNALGGGIHATNAVLRIRGIICAGNRSLTTADIHGSVTSLSRNLIGDARGAQGLEPHDLTGVDALLGALQDDGSGLPALRPLPGSPAIDAGNPDGFPATDQSGIPRPQGSGPDLGSVEVYDITRPKLVVERISETGFLLLQVNGLKGTRYVLEMSTDLIHWTEILEVDAGQNHHQAIEGIASFYRLRNQP
jgi:hypothetical protein